jgi:hypothetical protein
MEYFLVKGIVYKTFYMGEETRFDDIRLVKANSIEEAEQKYEDYWRNKTDEYSVYYHASGYATETIV